MPSDERVQRYERAVAMAVYGLGLTLQRLPSDFLERAEASAGDGSASGTGGAGGEGDTSISWEALLKEKRIWKLSRHSNPAVSCFCLMPRLIIMRPFVIHAGILEMVSQGFYLSWGGPCA